jgi:holo-[acyl-carrier protein] synthase
MLVGSLESLRRGTHAADKRNVKGAGTDIVSVERLGRSLARGSGFAQEVFTPGERLYCDVRPNAAQHYAARFAAKEAFLKAVGAGIFCGILLHDIEVVRDETGPPRLNLGPTAAAAMERVGAIQSHLSLSHERDYAIALVVIS